jgi:hypothetical protein
MLSNLSKILLFICCFSFAWTLLSVRAFGVAVPVAKQMLFTHRPLQTLYAKSKEEDLELTRQVILEYMEKSNDTTTVAMPSDPPAVATAAGDDN